MNQIPVFASVGAVNTGKTSTIATLIEDDRLRISRTPGETTECQRFDVTIQGEPVIGFYDTPGFQNAKNALVKLRDLASNQDDPIDLFKRFVTDSRDKSEFSEECKLLGPIIDGAGIIYVVDGSQPFRSIHEAEMEILRMTGRPRLGLINSTLEPTHVSTWEAKLNQHFNLVRSFNAHAATYFERIELLKTLAGIQQSWRPALEKAVAAFEKDWKARVLECAEILGELLIDCLGHQESAMLDANDNMEECEKKIIQKFEDKMRKYERDSHARIIKTFKHSTIAVLESRESILGADLFSEAVWELLGLNGKQLVWATTATGALTGLGGDALVGGHSLGLCAAAGAVVGGGSALVMGKARPKIEMKMPGLLGKLFGRQRIAGQAVKVGPLKNINFPWILIDRAVALFFYSVNRAHARQGQGKIDLATVLADLKQKDILSQDWNKEVRGACEKVFSGIRSGKAKPKDRSELCGLLGMRLDEIAKIVVST